MTDLNFLVWYLHRFERIEVFGRHRRFFDWMIQSSMLLILVGTPILITISKQGAEVSRSDRYLLFLIIFLAGCGILFLIAYLMIYGLFSRIERRMLKQEILRLGQRPITFI